MFRLLCLNNVIKTYIYAPAFPSIKRKSEKFLTLPANGREDERINAYAVIEGGELYERFIKIFNSVVSKYSAIVNARHGRRSHKQEVSLKTTEVKNV